MPRDTVEASAPEKGPDEASTPEKGPGVTARRLPVSWEQILSALHDDRVRVPADALAAAQEIDDTSRRRNSTPVRKLFVRAASADDADPPLARLVQVGGRGGGVALKLYLALIWRCSGEPFETSKPHRAWATLLGLEDPEGKGARRIASALKTLRELGLVTVRRVPAEPNVVGLLDESLDGSPYLLPSNEYARAPKGDQGDAQRAHNLYFKVPSRLWLEGDIQSLETPGLAMLLILLAEQADGPNPVWFSTTAFPARYRLSQKTRAAGTRELELRGLVRVDRVPVSDVPGRTSVFDRRRTRNLYSLVGAAKESAAIVEAVAASPPRTSTASTSR